MSTRGKRSRQPAAANEQNTNKPTDVSKKSIAPTIPESPPTLLEDVCVEDNPIMLEMIDKMAIKRHEMLTTTPESIDKLFLFIETEVIDTILKQNVFIPLDIAELFQMFCKEIHKYKEIHKSCVTANPLRYSKIKHMALQIMDEVVKELLHMQYCGDDVDNCHVDTEYDDEEDVNVVSANANKLGLDLFNHLNQK